MTSLKSTAKKASKLRIDFHIKYSKIAKDFNQVCRDMDSLLAEVANEEPAEE